MNACPECLAADVSRRSLLASLGVLGSTLLVGGGVRVAWADGPWQGDTVVVLSLRGGFDGLSAVVPLGDPDYADLRPTIAVPAPAALQLDSMFGMHPAMTALKAQWDLGRVAVVTATGLPDPNRSHFSAMDEVERAAPGSGIRTGWLDRMLSLHDPSGPFGAVQLGSTTMPMAFAGPYDELGMNRLADFALDGASDAADRARWTSALTGLHDRAGSALKTSASTTLSALETAAELAEYTPTAAYPDTDLGRTLQDVAQLIKSEVGARVITADEGDWDMHADLGRVGYGSSVYKQVYIYGGLDMAPTELTRSFGFSWGLGGWLLTPFMMKAGPEIVGRMRGRVMKDLTTTFASHYARKGNLEDMLTKDAVAMYNARRTGEKYLVTPND